MGQFPVGTDGKYTDTVVKPISSVHKATILGDQDLGTEIAPFKSGWKCRDRLSWFQRASVTIKVEQNNGGSLLLECNKTTCR
jgi:hypothetical protein